MSYNPFDKNVDELKQEDLEKLVSLRVTEGYFVECKSNFPSQEKTARTIASLANTMGGWFFVGVTADKTDGNAINSIDGIETEEHPDPVAKIRTAVTANVSPIPVFYTQQIMLDKTKCVIAVYVPQEQDTPFICKNGRVYHRVGDSSEPVSAKDRYTLDRLLDGRSRQRERRDRFCRDERTFSENETEA